MRSYSTEKNIRRPIWLVKARFSRIGVETFVYGCFFSRHNENEEGEKRNATNRTFTQRGCWLIY